MSKRLRVAIVGGGIAGLAAARTLCDHGIEVEVFDKGRAAGGRVATRRRDSEQFDHGAQFFTARDPAFAACVARLKAGGLASEWRGPFRTLCQGRFGPDPRPGMRYVGVPGMSAVPRALAEGLDVHVGSRVLSMRGDALSRFLVVERDSGGISEFGPYAAIVLALPPAQALSLLDASAVGGRIREAAASANEALQPCLCAMATFHSCVDGAEGGIFVQDEELSWVAHDGGKPQRNGRPTYVLHATARWSALHFDEDPMASARAMVDAMGRALATKLPALQRLDVHRWRYALATVDAGRERCAFDDSELLAIAVDALAGGRVEGAWISGTEAGDRLAVELAHRS